MSACTPHVTCAAALSEVKGARPKLYCKAGVAQSAGACALPSTYVRHLDMLRGHCMLVVCAQPSRSPLLTHRRMCMNATLHTCVVQQAKSCMRRGAPHLSRVAISAAIAAAHCGIASQRLLQQQPQAASVAFREWVLTSARLTDCIAGTLLIVCGLRRGYFSGGGVRSADRAAAGHFVHFAGKVQRGDCDCLHATPLDVCLRGTRACVSMRQPALKRDLLKEGAHAACS